MVKSRKNPHKKYFWKDMYIGMIPGVVAEMKKVVGGVGATELQMLDQKSVSQEAVLNAMILYFSDLIDREKIAGLESALREPFARLGEMVAKENRLRAAIEAGTETVNEEPTGISLPAKKKRPQGK